MTTVPPLARPPRRRLPPFGGFLRRLLLCCFLGLATTVAVAWLLAGSTELPATSQSAAAFVAGGRWTVTAYSRPGAQYVDCVGETGGSWSKEQVLGPPDTPTAGDVGTAWASATQDTQEEWLELGYDTPVVPSAVRVFESYNPGALHRVSVFDEQGQEITAWDGTDPQVPGTGGVAVADVKLDLPFKTRRVKIYLDSVHFPGWNEIDAVGLVDPAGNVQWATSVEASSVYGTSAAASGPQAITQFKTVLPAWYDFDRFTEGVRRQKSRHTRLAAQAHGWPWPALWCEREFDPTSATTAYPVSPYLGGMPSGSPGSAAGVRLRGGIALPPAVATSFPLGPPALPYRPVPLGLLLDALLYTTAFLLLAWLLTAPRRFFREVGRVKRGCCLVCGYDLGYDFIPGCPECGWRRDDPARFAGAAEQSNGHHNGQAPVEEPEASEVSVR